VVTWIVVAVIVLALIVLVLAARPVLSRLSGLSRALARLRRQAESAQALRARSAELETGLAGLRESAESTERRLAVLRARRGDADEPAFPRR
jgi:hypothetical protein